MNENAPTASGWDMYRLGIIHERNRIAAWLASDPYGQKELNKTAWSVTLDYAEHIQYGIQDRIQDRIQDGITTPKKEND